MDTESFTVCLKLKSIYIDISKDVESRFGSSKYELDRTIP